MNDGKSNAFVVLVVAGFALWLHYQGKFVPVLGALFETPNSTVTTSTTNITQPANAIPPLTLSQIPSLQGIQPLTGTLANP